jgi:flagellar assembly protein FliH
MASFSLPDVEVEAASILEQARTQAAILVEQARQDGRRDGMAQGLAEGRESGRREAIDQQAPAIAQLVSALDTAVRELDALRESLAPSTAQDATRLAIAIATKVCGNLGARSHAVAQHNVAAALRLIGRGREVRLLVHPSDAVQLRAILPELESRYPAVVRIDLAADPGIEPGGCRVHTAEGMIDAGLNSQLDRIAADLLCEP